MALADIVAQSGDAQDFLVEIPAGNGAFVPVEILIESDGALLAVETPLITGGGGTNVFIMSE